MDFRITWKYDWRGRSTKETDPSNHITWWATKLQESAYQVFADRHHTVLRNRGERRYASHEFVEARIPTEIRAYMHGLLTISRKITVEFSGDVIM